MSVYRVTAYEDHDGSYPRIVKREVLLQTRDPETDKVLSSRPKNEQVRDRVDDPHEAVTLVKEYLAKGHLVLVTDGNGHALDHIEWTDLAKAFLGK